VEQSRSVPVLLVHGGAGTIPDDVVDAFDAGVRRATEAGWVVLERGGSAVDAVEAAVVAMEADGAFDAGRGSILNRDGRVELDAMIMDGATLAAGAVAAVETVEHPIRVARAVMERIPQVYLVGRGAERFAADHGFEPIDNDLLITPRERRRFEEARQRRAAEPGLDEPAGTGGTIGHDTVGAVALDVDGNLAAGTSTGGMAYKPAGRVGDSSIIGSGGYADNESAAVSFTGDGESVMRLVLGKWAVDRVADGLAPEDAADAAIERLDARLGARAGLILLDRRGRIGIAFNTPRMAWAVRSRGVAQASVTERYRTGDSAAKP
jgi:beta-aspartyl-peptidase (threonine type)